MNFPEVAQGADEIARFHFRSFDIMPARDGILVQRFCHAVASPPLHESGNDFDVEDPTRQKWCRENLANVLRRVGDEAAAEELVESRDEYTAEGVFWVPPEARGRSVEDDRGR